MFRFLGIALAMILTSFAIFPIELVWFPGLTLKTAMAPLGLVMLLINFARQRRSVLDSGFLWVGIWAAAVFFISFVSITYNDTNDNSFTGYFISMLVWVCAAYVAVSAIKAVHGTVSVNLVANYLIAMCVAQCVLAFVISQVPSIENLVNSIFLTGSKEMTKGRLYGIGAGLDIAGLRFMAVLSIIIYMVTHLSEKEEKKYSLLYIAAFFIIALIGNMISRSTVFGVFISLAYLIIASIFKFSQKDIIKRIWKKFLLLMGALILGVIVLYQANSSFRNSMHFGFEGFFSLYEKGQWEVSSNNSLIWMLKNIKPENTRTWIIGDGYCGDPNNDPYYIGPQPKGGYYMGTDVGYMRFIFYFGVIGTLIFMIYFYQVACVCGSYFPKYKDMFFLILVCNFIGWIKVSTDIFCVFALFLAVHLVMETTNVDKIGLSQKYLIDD